MEGPSAAADVSRRDRPGGPDRRVAVGFVVSADTEYAGGAARDIPVAASALTRSKSRPGQAVLPILSTARILDRLQKKRYAGCYTGLDNTSWADSIMTMGAKAA